MGGPPGVRHLPPDAAPAGGLAVSVGEFRTAQGDRCGCPQVERRAEASGVLHRSLETLANCVVCRSEVTTAVHPRPDGADDPVSLGSLPWMRRRHAVEAGSRGLRCCRIVWRRVDLK